MWSWAESPIPTWPMRSHSTMLQARRPPGHPGKGRFLSSSVFQRSGLFFFVRSAISLRKTTPFILSDVPARVYSKNCKLLKIMPELHIGVHNYLQRDDNG